MAGSEPDARLKELLAPGNIFEGKYEVISDLGTGSFAFVVKARHRVMGRDVALKCLKPSVVHSNPEVSERFVNEVKIVSRLRHPNTVTIYDFGQTDDELAYMVLEYLEGTTLDEVLAEQGALSEERASYICRQILKSLAEAHSLGIIHRDLKPSNIMLTDLYGESDFVKVLDFGVAKLLEERDENDAKIEPRSTRFIGTPVYMSPEQVLGKPVGPASDLYSLGLIVYEMLTGRCPIEHQSVAAVVREHVDEQPLDLEGLGELSESMRRLIGRATRRHPQARYRRVTDFAGALPGDGALKSVEQIIPNAKSREKQAEAGLAEESSEADVFSGKNYIAPPDPNEIKREEKPPTPTPSSAPLSSQPIGAGAASPKTPSRPAPSPSAEKLDLDLDSVDRQRRRLERKRRAAGSSARQVDGGWEAREYWVRSSIYGLGLLAGYFSFVLLSALLYEQPAGARLLSGAMVLFASVLWTAFSDVKVVSADFARRWLVPSAQNMVYIFLVVFLTTIFWRPAEMAAGLDAQSVWFYESLPQVPPLTFGEAATVWVASQLAVLYEMVAAALPYA